MGVGRRCVTRFEECTPVCHRRYAVPLELWKSPENSDRVSESISYAIVMFLFTPLALGSYWTLPAFALVIPVIVFRLLSEEKILSRELPGYREYRLRTRFRLVPCVW